MHRHPRLLSAARVVARALRSLAQGGGSAGSVSTNYKKLDDSDIAGESTRLRSSWQDEALPARQRALVDKQLAEFRAGKAVDVFDVYMDVLREAERRHPSSTLLEVGCSSGYYSEVMTIGGSTLAYTGCDYSEALVRLARECYPELSFDLEDAARLTYRDKAFDIVVSGCCLLHIPEYELAIAEAARVARSAVIFHRTPVLENAATEFFRKQAYGVETIEIHFSETELLELFARYGLTVDKTIDLSWETLPSGAAKAVRTYVCSLDGSR